MSLGQQKDLKGEASTDTYLTPSRSNLPKPRKNAIIQQEQLQTTHEINRDQSTPCSTPTALHHAWDDADVPTPDMRNISSTTTLKLFQQQRLQEQLDLSLPTFPTFISARPSTLNTKLKQLKFYVAGKEGGVDATISPSSLDDARVKSAVAVPISKQWTFSERFFYSRDDQSVVVSGQPSWDSNNDPNNLPALAEQTSFPVAHVIDGADGDRDRGDDDDTCNNTIQKARKRSKKVSRASTVNAFVIFLKALFGVGMLSNPAVLGEVGLLLGTYCHLLIVIGCAFACYLLLTARQFAKLEVMENQRKGEEMRETYEVWRMETERRAAVQMRTQKEMKSSRTLQQNIVSTEMTFNCTAAMVQDRLTLPVVNTLESILSNDECTVDPMLLPTDKLPTSDTSVKNASRSNSDATSSHGTQTNGKQYLLNSTSSDDKSRLNSATDEYQFFSEDSFMSPPLPPPKLEHVRLVTYGDVAKYLVGKQASMFIVFAMVTGHIMFASGLLHLAMENLCYVVGWERLGWSYTQVYVEEEIDDRSMMRRLGHSQDDGGEHNNPNHSTDHASRSSDEEEYYLEWKGPDFIGKMHLRKTAIAPSIPFYHDLSSIFNLIGRMAMACLLLPIIHGLLQIPSLTELATISTVGLVTYAVGCIGSMLYSAVVLTEGHPFTDQPDDMWQTKWTGIPVYVATTIYCIEGINLALPTVCSIEGAQRWGGGPQPLSQSESGANKKEDAGRDSSVFIVVGAVSVYGIITLIVSWIGLAGGLGGGVGTIHGEDGCWDVTYCLNSSAVRFVYMLSLGIALILTLPVILYPSTQMLEVWLDDRNDERRKKMEAASILTSKTMEVRPGWSKNNFLQSLLSDDETVDTVSDIANPRPAMIHHDKIGGEESCSIGAGRYADPFPLSPESSLITFQNDDDSWISHRTTPALENAKVKKTRKLKYWKLRMCIAVFICVVGTIEGSFPSVLKVAGILRGVSLSITGLIVPPLLYMSALDGDFSVPMAASMALLIGLGLFNIVLVLMSAFGSKDFILEEGRQNFVDAGG
jgi:hypothetical protein